MSDDPSVALSRHEISTLVHGIIAEAAAGRQPSALQMAQPLRKAQSRQQFAAMTLLFLVEQRSFDRQATIDILSEIERSYDQDIEILTALGCCFERARDVHDLNAPPPSDPVFRNTVEKLNALAKVYEGRREQETIFQGLSSAARMLARQYDTVAESSHRKLTGIKPRKSEYHYNLGLFCKTRGRFEEGVTANQTAARLARKISESCAWNLGICATGAGNAAVALDVWKRIGHNVEIGRFGLPEGHYHPCKVMLAQRPLAERTAELDDPGDEETIWIQRLSPCHGIIRSVLYGQLGIDYGDVILFDGAPITHHTYDGKQVAVFPHLATLLRRNYQFFDFAGTQDQAGQLLSLSGELAEDAVVYPHSENVTMLCANCCLDPNTDHAHHEQMEKHVVIGRIAAPPHIVPAQLIDMIDKGIEKRGQCQLHAPDLCAAAGMMERERVDRRRFELLTENQQTK